MKVYLFISISVFFLLGCTPSTLLMSEDKKLILKHKNISTLIAQETVSIEQEYYKNIELTKYTLKQGVNTLFFESVVVDMNWEFYYGPITTLKYIFDGTSANIIYKDSSMSLLQLSISKHSYVNIMAESSGFNEMTYVYGFSDETFKKLCKDVVNKDIQLKYEKKSLENPDKPLTKWSTLMLFFQALIKPDVRHGFSF